MITGEVGADYVDGWELQPVDTDRHHALGEEGGGESSTGDLVAKVGDVLGDPQSGEPGYELLIGYAAEHHLGPKHVLYQPLPGRLVYLAIVFHSAVLGS